jgi:triosephosphate isomerase (TIM)
MRRFVLARWYYLAMLIISNWKSYVESRDEAKKLLALAKRLSGRSRRVRLVLAPSFAHLGLLAPGNRSKVKFGAQDISTTTTGPATGEVSGGTIRNLGAEYVIIGHSERRQMGESDAVVAEKIQRAVANGLTPVLCIGEKERDADAKYLLELKKQLAAAYAPLSSRDRLRVIVAYEPIWAIGKSAGDALASSDLGEMVLYIRKVLAEYLPGKSAKSAPIIYGGSVEPSNIRGLAGGSGVEGFLVGRASVDPGKYAALVKALS